MRKFILQALFCLITPTIFGQNQQACLRTYDLLKTTTLTSPGDLTPGAVVFLSRSYLESLQSGVFLREPSGLRHFDYLRPGTREEIRDGLSSEAAANGVLGPDGNVYSEVQTPPGWHFFKPKKGFHGDYEPTWRDPALIAPAGVIPVDVRQADGMPLRVLEFQPSFLRLRAGEEEWVFFTGYPDISFVFDSEKVRNKLAEKQRMANALIGQEFLIETNQTLRYLPTLGVAAIAFPPAVRNLELKIEEALVDHKQVLLGFGEPRQYLVLDQSSDARFYDLACLRESVRRALLSDPDQLEESNRKLSELMLNNVPVDTWSRDEYLVNALKSRFRLQKNDLADHRWYEHALLMRDDLYRQTFLTACLREDGACFLQSHFASERGLYHTKIEVVDRREELRSSRIPTLDDRSSRKKIGNWTVETITFTGDIDKQLMAKLVDEPQKPIMVRYIAGGSFFQEVELLPEYREVIRDMYLLSELIRFQVNER
ncbi:MAG: hypothetical protein NWR72_05665 [Bacteroidia bacterium]|nr:hypothetical protein [Bacteroidia bacterium]